MDLTKALCPKCRQAAFRPVFEHPRYARSASCRDCGGLWVQAAGLSDAVAATLRGVATSDRSTSHDAAADARAGLCPEGHGLLSRARIDVEPGFWLDRCMECNGLWFDRGEWERVANAGLAGDLFERWSPERRLELRRERSNERLERDLVERLGAELLAEVRDLGARLAEHPYRNQAVAELMAALRSGSRP